MPTQCPDCRGIGSAAAAFHGHTQHEDEICPLCAGTGVVGEVRRYTDDCDGSEDWNALANREHRSR